MQDIPLEKRLERYDAISQPLRDALNSEAVDQILWTIGEAHHLDEDRTLKMVKVSGFTIMGFIHPKDLQRELINELGIDKRLAEEIAHEIQLKILNPFMPEINAAFNYHITGVPAPSAAPLAAPTQPEILRPTFAPGQEAGSKKQEVEDQPFILREESEEPERVRPRDESLVRPSFYEGREVGGRRQEAGFERTAARLEIGPSLDLGRAEKKKPEVGKTEEPEIRVVHYSGPQTPVNPFGPQQEIGSREQETGPTKPPTEVHPENVVDLKDLPR